LAVACSHTAPTDAASGMPRFVIGHRDITACSVEGAADKPTVVHLELSKARAAEFQKFTRDHVRQQIQIVVDGKVVARPTVMHEVPGAKVDATFSSAEEARAFSNSLSKK